MMRERLKPERERYRYFVGEEGKLAYLRNPVGVPVIVDVFRASSTIVAALANGAEAVYPVGGISEARLLARRLDAILVGERRGVKIRDFDFGNSPTEMLKGNIKNRKIVLTTTIGTKLMVDGGVIASTLNVSRVVDSLEDKHVDFLIGGMGHNLTCVDDLALAKVIEKMLIGSDYSEWLGVLRDFGPSEYLHGLGYGDDVELICNGLDRFPILPVLRDGKITKSEANSLFVRRLLRIKVDTLSCSFCRSPLQSLNFMRYERGYKGRGEHA